MTYSLKNPENTLLGACTVLLLVAVFGPAIPQTAHYHHFADQRAWLGLPFAGDLLTNLPFAVWGILGLLQVWKLPRLALEPSQRGTATLFFAGLVLTAACSSWYHWQPHDAGLLVDRLGMTVAFAGLLGLAAAGRISARCGTTLTLAVLVLGPLSVATWALTANVLPWAVLQFGGMALVLWLASRSPLNGALPVRWALVILVYAAAKLLEQADYSVYELLGHTLSGHSLKHLIAGLAAWPVLSAIRNLTRSTEEAHAPAT